MGVENPSGRLEGSCNWHSTPSPRSPQIPLRLVAVPTCMRVRTCGRLSFRLTLAKPSSKGQLDLHSAGTRFTWGKTLPEEVSLGLLHFRHPIQCIPSKLSPLEDGKGFAESALLFLRKSFYRHTFICAQIRDKNLRK
jgi:hypothetical protein